VVDVKQIDRPLFYYGFWLQTKSRLENYYQRTLKNPQWLLMFVLGRFPIIRRMVAYLSERPAFDSSENTNSMFEDIKVDEAVNLLKKDGCYLGLKLPKDVLQEIVDFAQQNYCYGDAEPNMGFVYADRRHLEAKTQRQFVRGDYFNSSLNCPAIDKITQDRKLLDVARSYFGAEPVVAGTRLWWLFVNKTEYDLNKGAYFFHYDVDDYQCLKVFFYLTEVTLVNGAHVYVRGSHKKKKLKHLLSLFKLRSDREIIESYGKENLVYVGGDAGTGFVEDVTCFHKATPPQQSDRLMLQVQFSLNNYGNTDDFVEPTLLKHGLDT
jgi:Phytanoyl-CoA dioxygenase (PhyH)